MKMPQFNFTQSGLAQIFGIDLDDNTKAPFNTANKRTAIIAGTICGAVGLAIFVALGVYAAWKWRKTHRAVEEPVHEKSVYPDAHNDQIELPSNSMREQRESDVSS